MIIVDGSYGEGGGQILRTSASLAAITGEPVRVERVRAGRPAPGLKAQHLTAVQAAMRVCNGVLEGGTVGSTEVTMTPGSPVQPGVYEFPIGTAGSTLLVLQTVMLPLLRTEGESI
ncbi:RNA 3'-phosphate cyclase, partial [bacterium]